MGYRMQGVNRVTTMADIERLREERARGSEPCIRRIEPEPEVTADLPLLQQIALLGMMNSTLARGVARRIASINECQDRPSHYDYRALVAHGLCYRAEEDRYHSLTVEGWIEARKLLARLCRQHDIHIIQDQRGGGYTSYWCSCRQWSTTLYRQPGMHQFRRAQQRFYAHLPLRCRKAESA